MNRKGVATIGSDRSDTLLKSFTYADKARPDITVSTMFDPYKLRKADKIEEPSTAGEKGRTWPATFADRLTSPMPRARHVWQLLRAGETRAPRHDADRIPVQRLGLTPVAADSIAVTWVGHSTFVLQIQGRTILTDPVWGDIPGVPRRLTPPGVAWSDLPHIDAVVISHNHYDHLDARTIRLLPRDTPMLVPAGLGSWFTRRGFSEVIELDWWESHEVNEVIFDFVPAHHWSRRSLLDTCTTLWGGWIIRTPDGPNTYFAGDTGYGEYFKQIGEHCSSIEIALLPVGAYAPRWFHSPWHMDPDQAVQAFTDVGASLMVPMHWGTFIQTSEPVLEPLELTRSGWAKAGLDPAHLWDLAIGETRVLAPDETA